MIFALPFDFEFNGVFSSLFQYSVDHQTTHPKTTNTTHHLPTLFTLLTTTTSRRRSKHYSHCRPHLGPMERSSRHAIAAAIPRRRTTGRTFAHVSHRSVHRIGGRRSNGGQFVSGQKQHHHDQRWTPHQSRFEYHIATTQFDGLRER